MGTEALLERLHAQYAPVTADGDSAEAPVGAVRSRGVSHGVLVLELDREALLDTVRALRDQHGFDLFLDVTAVDWPDAPLRFEVVWHFYSTADKVRVRLKTRVAADDAEVDSLTSLYGSAGYMERECHDMYGIRFRGNDDLRPILLYEGFRGHPLRKDYPKQKEQPLVPYRPPQSALVR
ncbi:MAG: NADH-quinone oxidoreductase subunit C [Gemmatimonadaceae bacterium]|jgi:NADH-quinone oxidoreductase subunit C|nr:NADH-quinone oxidoreductase subunit C [Gemmatimonadaceae bacterium]